MPGAVLGPGKTMQSSIILSYGGDTSDESMVTVSLRRALREALPLAVPEDIRHVGHGPVAEAAMAGER